MLFIIINYVSMVIFLIDIIKGFLTSYVDVKSGDEIVDPKLIAYRYLSSGLFALDLMSTFPLKHWGRLGNASKNTELILSLFGLLKIQRYFRARKIISNMDTTVEWKAVLKLVYIIVLLFILFHLYACIFWVFIRDTRNTSEEWVPQTDYLYGKTFLHQDDQFLK